jgi:hypothetical protein
MNIPSFVPRSCSIKRTYSLKPLGVARGLLALVSVSIAEVAA